MHNINYNSISKAIDYIINNVGKQLSLPDIAASVNSSPDDFNRLLSQWAGISPERFLKLVTIYHAGKQLDNSSSIFSTSCRPGSGSGSKLINRLTSITTITPEERKTGGKGLAVFYGIHQTPFGTALIAISNRGITNFDFIDDKHNHHAIQNLGNYWRAADIQRSDKKTASIINNIFSRNPAVKQPLSLYVKGTDFQLDVWRSLLSIKPGQVCSYKQLANMIDRPDAYRAVGNALAANPVAYLIPCHRVISAAGGIGGYRWGAIRKRAILCRENG